MQNDFNAAIPGIFFVTTELEEIQTDGKFADFPSRTPMLPWQMTMFMPNISINDPPVAGCSVISIEKREVVGVTIDIEDLDVCIAIVRVTFELLLIP